MPNTDTQTQMEIEARGLENALCILNIAEKKARIYSRLLTEVSLAKAMEVLACSYEEQKVALQTLLYGKADRKKQRDKQNAGGMDEEKTL